MRGSFTGIVGWLARAACAASIACGSAVAEPPVEVEATRVDTASASPAAPSADAPTATPATAAPPACEAHELEPNSVWTRASTLGPGTMCGAVGSAADEDWYSVVYGPGDVTLGLDARGDATFAVGQAAGTTCVAAVTSLHAFTATASTVQQLCVKVTSLAKRPQSYTLTRR